MLKFVGWPAWSWHVSALHFTGLMINRCTFLLKAVWVLKLRLETENGPNLPLLKPFGLIFCVCLYLQCIGVHWRVPNGLVARQYVFGKGVGLAGLGEAGRPAASAQHESETCNLHNFCVRTPN